MICNSIHACIYSLLIFILLLFFAGQLCLSGEIRDYDDIFTEKPLYVWGLARLFKAWEAFSQDAVRSAVTNEKSSSSNALTDVSPINPITKKAFQLPHGVSMVTTSDKDRDVPSLDSRGRLEKSNPSDPAYASANGFTRSGHGKLLTASQKRGALEETFSGSNKDGTISIRPKMLGTNLFTTSSSSSSSQGAIGVNGKTVDPETEAQELEKKERMKLEREKALTKLVDAYDLLHRIVSMPEFSSFACQKTVNRLEDEEEYEQLRAFTSIFEFSPLPSSTSTSASSCLFPSSFSETSRVVPFHDPHGPVFSLSFFLILFERYAKQTGI